MKTMAEQRWLDSIQSTLKLANDLDVWYKRIRERKNTTMVQERYLFRYKSAANQVSPNYTKGEAGSLKSISRWASKENATADIEVLIDDHWFLLTDLVVLD